MKILLTFTGFHDPYSLGLVGEEQQAGPILSLVKARPFDHVVLISTLNTRENTAATESALRASNPGIEISIIDAALSDPTDYIEILRVLRTKVRPTLESYGARMDLSVAVASGTPQMHAAWLLMVASGELPARILHIRPPRFVTADKPLVSEVDLLSREFPEVRSAQVSEPEPYYAPIDTGEIIRSLGIVGDHPELKKALEIAATLASSDVPILILGETGTGKELLARFVHLASGRPAERFVAINCAATPKDLVESILFGHRKGSFTGAISDQEGKFAQADGGTLFLDELGELPLETQAKLLRVVQEGQIEPVGAGKPIDVDVRLIAATNANLARAIRRGKFREDLYYRLNVGEIRLPALRHRRSDIPKLALAVLDRVNASLKQPKRLTTAALQRLQAHDWPGNIRDLSNVIERSARLARSPVLDADDLLLSEPVGHADPLAALPEPVEGFSLEEFLSSARKQLVLRALEISQGNQSEAARLLGVTPQAVHKFLRKTKQ
ncbi:sigma 54-interacting transcriptional regulator [Thiohalobacter sp. IOR34]|uniref:sigma-54 interaction domain-containing protein n=1 Tax=Thiohalobacter sp. IOR34 TaxID=3057176 RepID=UPI0025AF6712|nr:sigma 54-interacting transcriptional regulator [Thiohalobacter sp. IOR34]WJW74725.1 sigma 54-interacting transcriptional regulator [Thiohalobacter sp. IOR34]